MKIVRPDLAMTLLEASRRRVAFLEMLVERIGVEVAIVHERAEVAGRSPSLREQFDLVVSRGTAALPVLVELCMPFVRIGGAGVFPKGPQARAEVDRARGAIAAVGAAAVATQEVWVPGLIERTTVLVVLHKSRATPAKFPRSSAAIIRRPLE